MTELRSRLQTLLQQCAGNPHPGALAWIQEKSGEEVTENVRSLLRSFALSLLQLINSAIRAGSVESYKYLVSELGLDSVEEAKKHFLNAFSRLSFNIMDYLSKKVRLPFFSLCSLFSTASPSLP